LKQNAGEGVLEGKENLLPQVLQSLLWINKEQVLEKDYFLKNFGVGTLTQLK
jgi:hypothetical protein